MLGIMLKVLLIVLALIGLLEILRTFIFWMLKTKNPGRLFLVLSFRGHDEQAEIALRSAAERAKWIGENVQIVCVDLGMDEQTRRVCKMASEDNPGLWVVSPEDLEKYWRDRFANT